MGDHFLLHEGIWFDKWKFDDAECKAALKHTTRASQDGNESVIVKEIQKTRKNIMDSLNAASTSGGISSGLDVNDLLEKVNRLESENTRLEKAHNDMIKAVDKLEKRISRLELTSPSASPAAAKSTSKEEADQDVDDDDDDIDLFGSDDDDEPDKEESKPAAVAPKKKNAPIAKSSVVLDVKPWDDETDMKAMEDAVREISMEGLLWGKSQLVPLAYGIRKLQIGLVCEDEKVSIEELSEQIEGFEDLVQSVDIAAFNKI